MLEKIEDYAIAGQGGYPNGIKRLFFWIFDKLSFKNIRPKKTEEEGVYMPNWILMRATVSAICHLVYGTAVNFPQIGAGHALSLW